MANVGVFSPFLSCQTVSVLISSKLVLIVSIDGTFQESLRSDYFVRNVKNNNTVSGVLVNFPCLSLRRKTIIEANISVLVRLL